METVQPIPGDEIRSTACGAPATPSEIGAGLTLTQIAGRQASLAVVSVRVGWPAPRSRSGLRVFRCLSVNCVAVTSTRSRQPELPLEHAAERREQGSIVRFDAERDQDGQVERRRRRGDRGEWDHSSGRQDHRHTDGCRKRNRRSDRLPDGVSVSPNSDCPRTPRGMERRAEWCPSRPMLPRRCRRRESRSTRRLCTRPPDCFFSCPRGPSHPGKAGRPSRAPTGRRRAGIEPHRPARTRRVSLRRYGPSGRVGFRCARSSAAPRA